MRPRPMEARNPDARAMRADPAPHEPVATRPPSPWQTSAPWIEDTTAAPAEYLAGIMGLGFGATVVQVARGGLPRDQAVARDVERYRRFGPVYGWSRCDQRHDADERADPIDVAHTVVDACQRLGISTYAANTEIRWDTTDHRLFLGTLDHQAPHLLDHLAVCTYPGGMPDDAHQLYLQRGVRTILVQTFGSVEPWTIHMRDAEQWGHARGYEISLPMAGCFKGASGYADAAAQGAALKSLPRHCYLVEQSGWRHISGSGYEWEQLMAGVR